MDVSAWLQRLGLGQYDAAFRDNEIDGKVLSTLTAEDLKELGVAALGHRRRLLTAIAELGGSPVAPWSTAVVVDPAPLASTDAAERRQLTVMFCDLVGSTGMSARLDPEDMREVVRAYQGACSSAIARYDGFVAKFMGDGVLAYFGFPRAHEEDAERAVRAGLDICAAVTKLGTPAKEPLKVRIGVATGVVVVGDLIGQGSAQEQAVVGDTPNLAARLQALAELGSPVIAESTKRLLGGTFELKALGPQTLKGFDAPVPAWAVLREAETVSRFEASRSDGMTPFVGREQDVALLVERWRYATEGEGQGQVVLLSGEPGIGKSRVLAALREKISGERYITVRYQCSPHHVNVAFYPIIRQIWHAAGFLTGETAAARLDKLEVMIALSGVESGEILPYLASLLSIPTKGRYPALELTPTELKERTISGLIALFVGLTQGEPVLALLEDAHWIDSGSLVVFGRLIERLPGLCALMVVTFRPEFSAPWLGCAHITTHALNRFERGQAVAMIDRVAGGKALPADVLEQIVVKTDGVPLFVEELTKTVLESGLLREESGSYVLAGALTPLAIPSTLHDSLMARLDRLSPVREIAQIGAAIGREFSYHLLEAVSPISGPALLEALRQLVASELVYGRGTPPDATYVFKHALVRDTAYSSLLRGRRQQIHAKIARALAGRFTDNNESAPAIIAHHYTEAGLPDEAARYWVAVADFALGARPRRPPVTSTPDER
jgi:class 3 adenylate cyclase